MQSGQRASACFAGMQAHVSSGRADEVDAIAPKRESAQREMERRIVAQLLTCLDDLAASLPDAADASAAPDTSTVGPDAAALRAPGHVIIIGQCHGLLSAVCLCSDAEKCSSIYCGIQLINMFQVRA